MGWPPNRESHRICDPINLGRGVVPTVFWGKKILPGAGDRCPYRTAPKALNLMGDWCGPRVRHQLIENRGALIRDHQSRELKKRTKKFSQERLCLLTPRLLMGDPGFEFIGSYC